MLGIDSYRGDSMEPAMGIPNMMEGFPRHYPFAGQGGYPAWPMIPPLPVPQGDFLHMPPQKPEDFSGTQRMSHQGFSNSRKHRSSQMERGGVSPPPSRERFSYTRYQLELLNTIYTKIRYPNSMQKQLIAKRVGIKRDQVKIWFQNRRRKDITGKKSKSDEPSASGPHQVPIDIRDSVLQELLKYENDPKGKKVADSQKAYEKKVSARKRSLDTADDNIPEAPQKRQRKESDNSSTSSKSTLPILSHDLPEIYFASEPSPQESVSSDGQIASMSRLSPHSRSTESTSFSSDHSSYQINSVESCPATPYSTDGSTASVPSPQPLTIVPSAQELDMNAPPNAVALPLEKATLERPRSLESPLDPNSVGSPEPLGPDSTDSGLGVQLPVSEKNNKSTEDIGWKTSQSTEAPPNKVAPPSEKINFDIAQLTKKAKPLSVNIPQQHKNSHDQNQYQNSNVHDFQSSENLATPSPVQPFNNPTYPQWNHNSGSMADKTTLQEQLYNSIISQMSHAESNPAHQDHLSSHYDKLYAPYMLGFYPDQPGFMPQGQQAAMPPFMLPNLNYPSHFSGYDGPSDLSVKKHYETTV